MIKHPNCEITVNRGMKPTLFCPLGLLISLGFKEADRFHMRWSVGYSIAQILLTKEKGQRVPEFKRVFPVGKAEPGAKLVGQARLLLTDPDISPVPRFQPVTKIQAWVGWVNGKLMLELTQPLQRASDRALRSYRTAKKARKLLRQSGVSV